MSWARPTNLLLIGGGIGAGYYAWLKYGFKTPAVEGMEQRFSAGGGTGTHTPARATHTGDPNNVAPRDQQNPKGVDSEFYKERISGQRDENKDPGVWPEKFYETQYGNKKSK